MHNRSDLLEHEHSGYDRRTFAELVGGVGSAAALILGLIYGVGALVKTAELRNAGVNVGTAFPLIPIQQHLSRGIEIFLAPGTLAFVAAIFILGAVVHRFPIPLWSEKIGIEFDAGLLVTVNKGKASGGQGNASESSSQDTKAEQGAPRAETSRRETKTSSDGSLWVMLGVAGLFVYMTTTLSTILTIIVSVALLASWLLLSHSNRGENDRKGWHWSTPALVVAAILTLGSASVVKAFAASTDLSVARLDLADSAIVTGQVITVTDQAWYLADDKGQIEVIDANRVVSGTVSKARPVKNPDLQKTLFHVMFPAAYARIDRWLKRNERPILRTTGDVEGWISRQKTILILVAAAVCGLLLLAARLLDRPRRGSRV